MSQVNLRLTYAFLLLALVGCSSLDAPTDTIVPSISGSMHATDAFVDPGPPEPFGKYGGTGYTRYTGRFEGTTELGDFRVPYELIVPDKDNRSSGTVLVEPPHFALGPAARDFVLGRDLLLGMGVSYATVGWATFQNNILDPTATDVFIGGGAGGFDDEIVVQFVMAIKSGTVPHISNVQRIYSYGYSQTSFLMHRILRLPEGQGLFDFTMLNASWWEVAGFTGTFEAVSGAGKVVVVQSEGDIVAADGEALRGAEGQSSDWRVYEVAGSAHVPDVPALANIPIAPLLAGTNPIDWPSVARAAFVAGDAWVREGSMPPTSVYMVEDVSGDDDPVYGVPTGIARDGNLNALGGIRFPNVELGTAQFIASNFDLPPGLIGLLGASVDLTCSPSAGGETRFPTHGGYVSAFTQMINDLQDAGFLLNADASAKRSAAAGSTVGKPGACLN